MQIERILKQQLVHCGPPGIRFTTFSDPRLPVTLWVNIVPAAWQQNPLHPEQQAGNAVLSLVQWDNHRSHPG
jgi:hypothetical protein